MENYYLSYSSALQLNISAAAYRLLSVLIKSHNNKTGYSYKSKATMAAECSCSVSTISRALRELKTKQLVKSEMRTGSVKQPSCKRQTSNYYYINTERLKTNKSFAFKSAAASFKLSAIEFKLYNYLCMRIGENQNCVISKTEIANTLNVSLKTVFYSLKLLQLKGIININRQINSANSYSLSTICAQSQILPVPVAPKMAFKTLYYSLALFIATFGTSNNKGTMRSCISSTVNVLKSLFPKITTQKSVNNTFTP